MHQLARDLVAQADDVESLSVTGAEICRRFGHWYEAAVAAGVSGHATSWARNWSESLIQRAELLEQYSAIASLGAAAAGGAGMGLGMARTWALGSPELDFSDWYAQIQAQIAADQERRRKEAAGVALAERFRDADDLLFATDELIAELTALGPFAVAAFFEELGAERVYDILELGYYDPIAGLGWEFDEAFAAAMARAWDDLPDDFTVSLMQRSPWEMLFTVAGRADFSSAFLGMLGAKMASQGYVPFFSPTSMWYYPDAMERLYELIESDAAARRALATSPLLYARWDEPFGPFDEWVVRMVAEELPRLDDEAFLALIDTVLLPDGAGATLDNTELAEVLIGHALERDLDPSAAAYVTGVLVHVQASNGVPISLEPAFAEQIATQMPILIDVTNGVRGAEFAAFTHPTTGGVLTVDGDLLSSAISNTVRNEEARAALLEGLTGYFTLRAAALELAGASHLFNESVALADDIGAMTGLVITAINAADIKDAKDRDEALAATVGMVDTVIGIIPGPGGTLVEGLAAGFTKDLIKNAVNTTYNELIDRGLELFDSSHEGGARVEADEFRNVFSGEMEELLVVALVDAEVGIDVSVTEFLATDAGAGLDPSFWDASSGFLADDVTQRIAYNQWYEWVGHEYPTVVSAVTVYLTQLQSSFPVWND
jgi:hypothetical protein